MWLRSNAKFTIAVEVMYGDTKVSFDSHNNERNPLIMAHPQYSNIRAKGQLTNMSWVSVHIMTQRSDNTRDPRVGQSCQDLENQSQKSTSLSWRSQLLNYLFFITDVYSKSNVPHPASSLQRNVEVDNSMVQV